MAGQSRRSARNTLSRRSASSLKAMKWLQACSAYRKKPRTTAKATTQANRAVRVKGVSKRKASSTAYPPKIVIKAAHRCPTRPMRIARSIKPVKGFTNLISRAMT